jgi:hypothetical protein
MVTLCESLTLGEVTIGHVLEVESPAGPVRAVVHPLTLTEPARRALGVPGDVVQVVICGPGGGAAIWLARGEDVVMRLWRAGLSHAQAEALGRALYNLLTWDDPDAVAGPSTPDAEIETWRID